MYKWFVALLLLINTLATAQEFSDSEITSGYSFDFDSSIFPNLEIGKRGRILMEIRVNEKGHVLGFGIRKSDLSDSLNSRCLEELKKFRFVPVVVDEPETFNVQVGLRFNDSFRNFSVGISRRHGKKLERTYGFRSTGIMFP